MTVRSILPFGDPILRKVCKPVTEITPRILTLLDDLRETLYAEPGRAGLAAPQIGVLRRVAVMDLGNGLIELINPEMIEADGEQYGSEGCLSFPNYYGNVRRAKQIKVSSLTRDGNAVVYDVTDYTAVCFQHEMDHLDGKLFVDLMEETYLVHERTNQRMSLLDVLKVANGK
ncbi:peptide deformylase [Paenibacillus sp. 481]|uniref:peptide deformylase n=1 Tax=Paenibacillus sp. 481 TaxID=2835869 RepID=UPI001E5D814B|nr:peptide deformylase [Paenibacillus sp. 481]UHA74892.1 peptide deformylase [Paenibacillus sp. 481]